MLRLVDFDEMKVIYGERIMADFPSMERRPLSMIRKLMRRGRYVCLVLEEGGRTAAYAAFLRDDAIGSVFLDYYAVDSIQRGKGVGSRFLELLRDYWAGKSGIILECESPETAADRAQLELRQRRIAFYLRGGAVLTPILWRAFGVDYRILYLPIALAQHPTDIAADLTALYRLAMPRWYGKLFTAMRFAD